MSEKLTNVVSKTPEETYARAREADLSTSYPTLEAAVRERLKSAVPGAVFRTQGGDELWTRFLKALPADYRQVYNCNCCRRFITNYGGLVTIGENGMPEPLLWDKEDAPEFFYNAVVLMRKFIIASRVSGVFVWDNLLDWGTPLTGRWTHFGGTPMAHWKANPLKTPEQEEAEKKEEFGMLSRALSNYKLDVAKEAVRFLESDTLHRSDVALQCATWFLNLHLALDAVRRRHPNPSGVSAGTLCSNVVWTQVAKAPAGWCHVSTSMIGTLLEDIKSGLSVEVVKARWDKKVNPFQYLRPQAAPSDGAIKRAEEIFAKLGLAPALRRRFARFDEVEAMGAMLWKPAFELPSEESAEGVFSHLRPKHKSKIVPAELDAGKITWEKFKEKVLPYALEIEFMATPFRKMGYYGFVTAAIPTAPPVLQWDSLEHRNPFSWYLHHGGSIGTHWNVSGLTKVNGIFSRPSHWVNKEGCGSKTDGVFLILEGAKDSQYRMGGSLFCENLRSELHEVRAVVEAHVKTSVIEGIDFGTANGVLFDEGQKEINYGLRVRTQHGWTRYVIDRWN